MDANPIKIGLVAELTGPLSFMGVANANLMTMLVDDINQGGGLLGRRVELIIEDGETTDSVAKARTAKLIDVDRVDVVIGGIYSSTRQAIKSEAVARGRFLSSNGEEGLLDSLVNLSNQCSWQVIIISRSHA
jgi:ABC-type branched-subunit amino acid transport system substrate-binding protein